MADPVPSFIVTPIAATITACLTPVTDLFRESVSSCLFLACNRSSLNNSLRSLEAVAKKLKASIEVEEAHLRICNPDVSEWLKKVEEVVIRSKPLLLNGESTSGDYQHGTSSCCNATLLCRFSIGRMVIQELQNVNSLLMEHGQFTPPFTSPPPPEEVLFLPIQMPILGIDGVMDQVWLQFNDKSKSVIGLYGLPGVGKTTILKQFNNNLREMNRKYEFQTVIMLEVANAKMLNVAGMQGKILERLGLQWNEGDSDLNRAAFIHKVLMKKKFVVLLDDVWEKFNLENVGIPTPFLGGNGSKLIVASRKESVCANMGAERPIEVHCLQEDEAWRLFLSKLTENVKAMVHTKEDMKQNAMEIVKFCDGLPLAINAIGHALAVNDIPETWCHAAVAIKQNPSSIEFIDQMLRILKYSYDMLTEIEKKCFLYCTMFPDYGSIRHEQLIDYWVAEGFISPEPYEGYPILSKLLSACLLQKSITDRTSEVKIHQMIRKMGHQQVSTENKLLINAGQALEQAPDTKEWEEATRISLMFNNIKELSISPNCRKLRTLLLQHNPNLNQIGPKFFCYMPVLKVLDLSYTAISMLPDCKSLVQLVYLNLSHTPIKKVPKQLCSALLELQHLDMSHTLITELPQELVKLKKLTHLNLGETSALVDLPHGTISKLFKLKFLNLYKSNYGVMNFPKLISHSIISRLFKLTVLNLHKSNNGVKELSDLNFMGLRQLAYLGITIYSQQDFHKLAKCNSLARCTRLLSLLRCAGMKSIHLSEFKTMSHLMELHIDSCDDLEELIVDCNDGGDSMKRLKVLTLINLSNLVKVSNGSVMHRFEDLHDLTIHNCPKLKDASWALRLERLERLVITDCNGLERLIPEALESVSLIATTAESVSDMATTVQPLFSGWTESYYSQQLMAGVHFNAVRNERRGRPKANSFRTRRFLYLESITVDRCPNLTKLPMRNVCPNLKHICGEESWWGTIEPEVKADFGDFFVPI